MDPLRRSVALALFFGASIALLEPRTAQARRPILRKWPPELHDIVSRGDLERLKKLLDVDPTLAIDAFSTTGTSGGKIGFTGCFTLLHDAVNYGQLEVAEELLRRGANVNARPIGKKGPRKGETPLHIAARVGHSQLVPLLIKHGAELEAVDGDEDTPLRVAVIAGRPEAAKLLATAGATQDVFSAAGLGNVTLLEHFLGEDPAEANARTPSGHTPLHCAAATGELATAKLLLARGAAIDPEESPFWGGHGDAPLHRACMRGHLPMCRLLVESGADLDKQGSIGPPLNWAVFKGDLKLAEFLISSGASLSTRASIDGCTPLHIAAQGSHIDMAELLLKYGADINAEGGDYNDVPNARGDDGRPKPTPLDEAVGLREGKMAQFLVSRGARLGRESPEDLQKLLKTVDDSPAGSRPGR